MALSKSKRVNLIQNIAGHLESQGWTTIDLTLKQFGFPTTDTWGGDTDAYVVKMISDGKDAELVELAEHLGIQSPDTAAAAAAAEAPYWEEGQLKVFISHLSANRKQAGDLQGELAPYGMSCFVAHKDIHPTMEWQTEIETALATCDLLVALIYPDFKKSDWCDQEIGYALGRGVPVFTVRCGADPTGFVSRFQAFAGAGKTPDAIATDLFDAALGHKKLQAKVADVLVDQFVNSGSFAAAKRRVAYLERLTIWDPSYSARIAKAAEDNDQIRYSWGVPEQVKMLVDKWS